MNAAPPFPTADFAHPLPYGTTLLEASAGTGKTYTLAALYLRLLLQSGLRVQEILVTTFTIAATAELRARIRSLLRTTLDAFGSEGSEHKLAKAARLEFAGREKQARERLTHALRDFDEASILTIHGFCQRVLGDRSFESAALLDEQLVAEENALLQDVALDYWRTTFYRCSDCLSAALEEGGVSVAALVAVLKLRLEQPAARLRPESAPKDFERLCGTMEETFEKLRECWQREGEQVRHCFSAGANGWAKYDYGKAEEMRPRLRAVGHCLSGQSGHVLGQAELGFFARSKLIQNTRKGQNTPHLHFFALCEELSTQAERFATAVRLDFLQWAPERLAARKAQLGVHTFGDLLTRVHASLQGPGGPAMIAALRQRYRAALVDEFQDTDPVQDAIFQAVFGHGESWLFLIGDPKQAIYTFRGADVFTYLQAKARIESGRQFTLGTNYRSRRALVTATNAIFERSERSFVLPELEFHPVESGGEQEEERFTGDEHTSPLRIWQYEGDSKLRINVVRDQVFGATAAEIARLLSGEANLGDRRITPNDIAVLVMTNNHARDVQDALEEYGLPTVLLEVSSVFLVTEARDLHRLLSAVLRPADEGLLRAALATPALGVTLPDLDALTVEAAAWERWANLFLGWHAAWQERGFMAMFQRLLTDADVPARLLAQAGGKRRLTNLQHLAELLQKAALEERLGPRGLVKWLARQIAQPPMGDEQQMRLERDDEAVRVVTIHRAKGLEYNVVFCPLLVHRAREPQELRYHEPGSHVLTLHLGSPDNAEDEAAAEREQLADEVRRVYVALTRARQRCDFVSGNFTNFGESALAWLLHAPPVGVDGTPAALSNYVKKLPPARRALDLQTLVEHGRGSIVCHSVPGLDAPVYQPAYPPPETLRARPFGKKIVRDYCVSSFSSLTESHDAELPDYDAPRPEALAPETVVEPEGIHALPGGTRTGVCLHEVFEELDFTDDAAVAPLVEQKLAAFSLAPEKWAGAVTDCVRRTMHMPLQDGFRLAELTSKMRRAELEFFLPAGRLEAGSLRRLLSADGLERLDFAPRQGWLKGFIDLLAVHEGRYYIFDWKTNRLGDHAGAYGAPAIQAAMASHRYTLQLHLYTLAVHRYLRQRVARYDYDTHFGGAYYLFLRGLDPARPELGIHHQRPKARTVAALENWLEGPEPTLF